MELETRVIEKNGRRYLECLPNGQLISSEADALELVGACYGEVEPLLMLHSESLPDAFFDLKTGLAGGIMLKLSNYSIRTVVIVTAQRIGTGRFAEMVMEENRRNQIRFYETREQAEAWLIGG